MISNLRVSCNYASVHPCQPIFHASIQKTNQASQNPYVREIQGDNLSSPQHEYSSNQHHLELVTAETGTIQFTRSLYISLFVSKIKIKK
jgi:hypothetical protein